jgi:hypothetical protein
MPRAYIDTIFSSKPGKRRGLAGVKLVISDAHEGLKAAVTKVLRAIRASAA